MMILRLAQLSLIIAISLFTTQTFAQVEIENLRKNLDTQLWAAKQRQSLLSNNQMTHKNAQFLYENAKESLVAHITFCAVNNKEVSATMTMATTRNRDHHTIYDQIKEMRRAQIQLCTDEIKNFSKDITDNYFLDFVKESYREAMLGIHAEQTEIDL